MSTSRAIWQSRSLWNSLDQDVCEAVSHSGLPNLRGWQTLNHSADGALFLPLLKKPSAGLTNIASLPRREMGSTAHFRLSSRFTGIVANAETHDGAVTSQRCGAPAGKRLRHRIPHRSIQCQAGNEAKRQRFESVLASNRERAANVSSPAAFTLPWRSSQNTRPVSR